MLRTIATHFGLGRGCRYPFTLLRTYYDENSHNDDEEAKIWEWVETQYEGNAEDEMDVDEHDRWWRLLSDDRYFNIRDDFQQLNQAYHILPELASKSRIRITPDEQRGSGSLRATNEEKAFTCLDTMAGPGIPWCYSIEHSLLMENRQSSFGTEKGMHSKHVDQCTALALAGYRLPISRVL